MAKKVVIQQPITDLGVQYLKEKGYDVYIGDGKIDLDTMKNIVKDADGILARTAPYPKEVLSQAKNLKVIGRFGVGLDNIDTEYCKEKGIWVTIAPKANSNAVAEHTIGFIFAAAHNIIFMDKETRAGNWEVRNKIKGHDLSGKTLGLVGFGRIGKEVAKKAALGLDMKILAYDPFISEQSVPDFVKLVSLETLLQKADFVSIHMPATEATKDMVNKEFLSKMRKEAVLINCARGAVVNEKDLYEALEKKEIAVACLDVMKEEPANIKNPLFTLENVIFSPHNAGLTSETMDLMGLHAAMGIDDVLSGRKPKWPFIAFD